jgi:hypothetical protein
MEDNNSEWGMILVAALVVIGGVTVVTLGIAIVTQLFH